MSESTEPAAAKDTQSNQAAVEPNQFQQAAQEQEVGLISEFIDFLKESRAWWMTPIVIVLILVGVLVYLSGSVIAPFIYPIF